MGQRIPVGTSIGLNDYDPNFQAPRGGSGVMSAMTQRLGGAPGGNYDRWESNIRSRATGMYGNEKDIGAASKGLLSQYQNMLGGLQGPVSEAMRQRSLDTIRSQYGTQLRGAQDLMARQGVRGPAAIAAGADIRNQMGRAISDYERDLVIADYQAKLAALNNLNQYVAQERGGILGTEAGLRQLGIAQQYGQQAAGILG